jgi:hypothetical protein
MIGLLYFLYYSYITNDNQNQNENIKKYNYYKKYDEEYELLL